MNKDYMRETIIFKAKDNNGNIVECTPHLFVVALAKATGTNVDAVKSKISKSSSKFKKKLEEVLNEKRLPTGGELMSFTTILGTSKDKVEKAFAVLVKAGTIKSNDDTTKAPESESEVNTLNLQFTWPKDWGENVKEIGEAICEIFRSGDFKNNSLFCNYSGSDDTIVVAADSGKFESPKSFGKFIEDLRTVINYIYINSPFDASVNELDEPIYKLVDDAVYSTLHEVALNGVEEGVDLAPLQKYLYQKGVVNLPNVNDDIMEPNNQVTDTEQTASKSKIVFEIECDDKLVEHPAFSKYFTDGNVAKFVSTFKPDENDIKDPKVAYDFFSDTMKLVRLTLSDLYYVYYKNPAPASLMMPLWEFQQRCGSSYEDQLNAHDKICSLTLPSGPLSCFFPDGKPIVPSCFRPKESVKKADTATITNTPEIEMTLPKVTIKSSSGKIDEQLIRDVVKTYNGKVDLEIDI